MIALSLRTTRNRQAFMAGLVEHLEHPILAAIVGAVLDKVVGPDMTRAAGRCAKSLLWASGFFISPHVPKQKCPRKILRD